MYAHALRTGFLAQASGAYYAFEQEAMLYAGLLHHLENTTMTYELISKVHLFTAAVIVRIHCIWTDPDSQELFANPVVSSPQIDNEIELHARLVSLADIYDFFTAKEGRNPGNKEGVKALFRQRRPDDYAVVEELIDRGVLDNTAYLKGKEGRAA